MNRHRMWVSRVAAAVFLLCLCGSPGAAATGPDAVTRWNEHLVAVTTPPAVNRPNPEIAVVAAYMHIAMYDAISSIDGDYTPFVTHVTNVPAGASREAAAIEAAYRMAIYAYPVASPFSALAAQFTGFYTTEMGAIAPSQAKTDGMAVGLAAANGLISNRQGDGFRASVAYTFLPLAPGVYQKTPGPDGTINSYTGPATPWMAQFRPFAILRPDQFHADPPPALDSAQWASDYNEVKEFGGASTLPNSRTPEQEEIGLFYGAINAMLQVQRNLQKVAMDQDLTADLGRVVALHGTGGRHALGYVRRMLGVEVPVQLLAAGHRNPARRHRRQRRDRCGPALDASDRHAHTSRYPSAHGCGTSAYAHAIEYFFGTKRLPGGITLTGATGHPDRHFDSTDEIIREIIDARVYNGVHYRTSVVEGTVLGRKVAQWVDKFYFKPTGAHVPQGPKKDK